MPLQFQKQPRKNKKDRPVQPIARLMGSFGTGLLIFFILIALYSYAVSDNTEKTSISLSELSNDVGKGLVTIIEIDGDTLSATYADGVEKISKKESGRRVDASIASNRENRSNGAVYIFELNKRHDIDGNMPYNIARHINHSCDPNSEAEIIRGKIWIIALRDIAKGEEITYNYGYDFEDYEQHPCHCRTSRCVGFIMAEEHWPRLQEVKK